jgi:hypothetical protein
VGVKPTMGQTSEIHQGRNAHSVGALFAQSQGRAFDDPAPSPKLLLLGVAYRRLRCMSKCRVAEYAIAASGGSP